MQENGIVSGTRHNSKTVCNVTQSLGFVLFAPAETANFFCSTADANLKGLCLEQIMKWCYNKAGDKKNRKYKNPFWFGFFLLIWVWGRGFLNENRVRIWIWCRAFTLPWKTCLHCLNNENRDQFLFSQSEKYC